MATTWLDYAIGGGIAIVGLFILYRALKEPLDLLFGLIGKGLGTIKGWITGDDTTEVEMIQYG